MDDSALQYTIEVDDEPARKGTDRVNKSFDSLSQKALSTGVSAAGAFNQMASAIAAAGHGAERATVTFAGFAYKAIEAGTAAAGSFLLAARALESYAFHAVSSTGVTDSFVASLRALRLAASAALPETFGSLGLATFTVGLGFLAEESLRAAYAQGKLAEQLALTGEKTGYTPRTLQELYGVSGLTGVKVDTYTSSIDTLEKRLADPEKSREVTASLNALGVSLRTSTGDAKGVVEVMREVGSQFDSVRDPIQRAAIVFGLFGKEGAEKALPALSGALSDNIERLNAWGAVLSNKENADLADFKRTVDEVGASIRSLGDDYYLAEKAAGAFAARAGLAVFRGLKQIGNSPGLELPFLLEKTPKTPNEIELERQKRETDARTGFFSYLTGRSDDAFNDVFRNLKTTPNAILSQDPAKKGLVEKQLQKRLDELDLTFGDTSKLAPSLKASIDAQRASLKAQLGKYKKNEPTGLVEDDSIYDIDKLLTGREAAQSKVSVISQGRDAALQRLLQDDLLPEDQQLEDATKLVFQEYVKRQTTELKKAQNEVLGFEIRKRQQEALRTSQEIVYRSQFDPEAGKDIRSETLKATTLIDDEGEVHRFKLLDETRRNLETAFHTFEVEQERKAQYEFMQFDRSRTTERVKQLGELFNKAWEYEKQTRQLDVATVEGRFAHQNQLAAYQREEQLGALAQEHPQTVAGKLALEQRKLAIEKNYATTTSVNDVATLDRSQTKELTAVAQSLNLQEISPDAALKRFEAIQRAGAEKGTELNDKYTHDLITAQQNAANASVEIVRSAQLKEFDSLKQSIEGVLQESESRGTSVFQSIAHAAKTALLGAFNEILSSQIAGALFRVLNPGATVSFDSTGLGTGRFGKFGGILGGLGLGTQPVFGGAIPGGSASVAPSGGTTYEASPYQTEILTRGDYAPAAGSAVAAIFGSDSVYQPFQNSDLPISSPVNRSLSEILGVPDSSASTGPSGTSNDVAQQAKVIGHLRGHKAFAQILGSLGFGGGRPQGGYVGAYDGPSTRPWDEHTGNFGSEGGRGIPFGGLDSLKGFFGFGSRGTYGSGTPGVDGAPGIDTGTGFGAGLKAFGKSDAAALGGGLLLMDGLKRGGLAGTLEDTAGGAAIGYKFGGPIGAAVGAAVGLGLGVLRMTVWQTLAEQVKKRVRDEYHIDINSDTAQQIAEIARQQYGGSIAVALHSQQVMAMLGLYAETTGQGNKFGLMGPQAANLAYSGGSLYQAGTYHDGSLLGFQSGLRSLNPFAGTIQSPSYDKYGQRPSQITLALDGASSAAFLQGQTVSAMGTPGGQQAVSDASLAASQSSYNRLQQFATMSSPSTVIA